MASKHTTSIVDISEIEDDEQVPLNQAPPIQQQADYQRQVNPSHQQNNSKQAAQFYLYNEDFNPRQRIPNVLSTLINSSPAQQQSAQHQLISCPPSGQSLYDHHQSQMLPAIDYNNNNQQLELLNMQSSASGQRIESPDSPVLNFEDDQQRPQTPKIGKPASASGKSKSDNAGLGTLSGVYFPCVQNIFGVILFIRMVWIVGTAGVPAAFSLVFICCCVTLTTSISLSAIATNGIVPAGGPYFMISRSLGPECGGAVGTMFFLGTTVAGAMYITGAVEIMLNYLCPSWGLFGDFQRDVSIMYHNIRVYGTLLLILVGLLVWIGVKFVSKLAPIALFCVLLSIFSIYAGIFINYNGRPDLMICVMGDRLVSLKNIPYDDNIIANQHQSDPAANYNPQGDYQGSSVRHHHHHQGSNNSRLSSSELASLVQLRRTRALCTFEKLRHIYCPNVDQTNNQLQQQEATSSSESSIPEGAAPGDVSSAGPVHQLQNTEAQLMAELFTRAPNMSNCDPYFRANKDRIHLEKAVPGK